MNKKQAIAAMLCGEKVRLPQWDKDLFVRIDEDGDFVKENGETFVPNLYKTEGWEIYRDTKGLDEVLSMMFGFDVSKLKPEEPKAEPYQGGCPYGYDLADAEQKGNTVDLIDRVIDALEDVTRKLEPLVEPKTEESCCGYKVGDEYEDLGKIIKIDGNNITVVRHFMPENIEFQMDIKHNPKKTVKLEKWLCTLEGSDGYEIFTASEEYFESVAAVIGVQRIKKLGEETVEIEG